METEKRDIAVTLSKDDLSLREKLDNVPPRPGVYQFRDAQGKILYVGKAINLRNRVRQYFQKSNKVHPRTESMVSKVSDVEVIVTDSEIEALILEATLIKRLKPRYNVDLKDDKSYPYIVITHEPYPRVFVIRRIIRDGSRYFGPYTDVKSMRSSLKMIREIFMVRSCNFFIDEASIRKRKIKVCLDYHIKKCGGPCESLVTQEQYNRMIDEVTQVLKGKTSSLISTLDERMRVASEELRFEEAAELRDRIRQLSVYGEKQKVVDADLADRDLFATAAEGDDACGVVFKVRDGKIIGRQHVYMNGVEGKTDSEVVEHFVERYYLDAEDLPGELFLPTDVEHMQVIRDWLTAKKGKPVDITVPKIGDKAKLMAMCRSNAQLLLDELKLQRMKNRDFITPSVKSLQRDLRLERPPRRIECFDISNLQGTDSVGSMVVFQDAKPRKSEYRKFKIRTVHGPDDFASMKEVIERRYARLLEEQGAFPDLIMVDGGKGQLSSAVEILQRLGVTVPVIGLAKRLEEVFVPESSDPQSLPRTSPGLKLLQQVRDEAHRFAISYHRTLRSKRTLQTELDLVKGVGKKRAKELLETFGSVQGVKFATNEQLADVVGEKVAAKIVEYFGEQETA